MTSANILQGIAHESRMPWLCHGYVPRCGVVPTVSDLEVIAMLSTAEVFAFYSENMLFKRLSDSVEKTPNLVSRRQFHARRKLAARVAKDIRKDIADEIGVGEDVFVIDSNPVKVCQMARANRRSMGDDNPPDSPSKDSAQRNRCALLDICAMLSAEYAEPYIPAI